MQVADFYLNGRPVGAEFCKQNFMHSALSQGMPKDEAQSIWDEALNDDWRGAQARESMMEYGVEIVLH